MGYNKFMVANEVSDKQLDSSSQLKPDWVHSNYLVWGLFCLALAVRLFHLYDIKNNPFFNNPLIDAFFHDVWARQLVAGDWFSSAQGVFLRPPFYSYFMALVYKVFGHSYLILRLIQLIMGAVSCWFIYLLGRDYFSRRVGVLAFILASLYGTFIYFEGKLLIVNLHIFLNLLLLLSLTRANQKDKIRWWVLSGLILGLSALTVPTILVFLPFLLLWLYRQKHKTGQAFLRPAFLLILSTLLTIAPVTVHNYMYGQGFTLISANGGINFYLGNNLDTDKTIAIRPGIIWDRLVVQPHLAAGHVLNEAEADRYWVKKVFKFIGDYPGDFAQLWLKKLALFWQAHEIRRTQDIYFFKRYSHLLRWPLFSFGLVAPFALAGIGLTWVKRRRNYLLLFYLLAVMLGVLLFFVTARHRLPAVPVLIIFAAYFLNWLWEKTCQRDYPKVSYAVMALVLMGGLINYDFWGLDAANSFNFAHSHHNLGFISHEKGRYRQAIDEWNTALKLYAPGDLHAVDTHLRLAHTYTIHMDDSQKAIEHYQEGLKILPDEAELESKLGWIYYQQGLVDKGIETLKKAQRSDPLYGNSYLKLTRVYIQEGDFEKVRQVQQQAISSFKKRGEDRILKRLAKLYFKQGLLETDRKNLKEAEDLFQMTLENKPNFAGANYHLGLVYLNSKRGKQAINYLQKAASLEPKKAEIFSALGSAYLEMGHKEQARQAFSHALEINPSLDLARQGLKRIKR